MRGTPEALAHSPNQMPLPLSWVPSSFPLSLSQAYGRDYRFRPSQGFSSPPPTQKASPPAESHSLVDPDAAGARRAPGRDTTKRIPPFLHPFPPDDSPSAYGVVLVRVRVPQPRRFCRSQSGIAGCSRCAQRSTLSLDAPVLSDNPPRLRLAHALPDDTPRPTRHGGKRHGGNQLP